MNEPQQLNSPEAINVVRVERRSSDLQYAEATWKCIFQPCSAEKFICHLTKSRICIVLCELTTELISHCIWAMSISESTDVHVQASTRLEQTKATAFVHLLQCLPECRSGWTKKCTGVACFVKDNAKHSYFIRVYDLTTKIRVWEQELYKEFKYNDFQPRFHTFAADEFNAALSFRDVEEARHFKKEIDNSLFEYQQKRQLDTPLFSGSYQESFSHVEGVSHDRPITKDDIGKPSGFRHEGHIGWDPQSGFEIDNVPMDDEWKKLQIGDEATISSVLAKILARGPEADEGSIALISQERTRKKSLLKSCCRCCRIKSMRHRPIITDDISKPFDFRHEGHIGWNSENRGFEINNVPMDDELVKKILIGDEAAPSSVPAEILARGLEAVNVSHKALIEGKTNVRGGERAEKTSLLKYLPGEKFNPQEENTTSGIEIGPPHCKVTNATWKAGQTNGDDVTDVLSSERRVEGVSHDRPIIGKPSGFRHEGHIGLNSENHGFENDVPMDDEQKNLIFARGPEAVETFQKALSEGKARVRAGERARKTSSATFFKGEKFNSQQESATWKAGQTNGDDVTDVLLSERHVEGVSHDRPIIKDDISKPFDFRHEGHIGWNSENHGFENDNVPMDDEQKKLIFARGPEAVEALQKALSESKTGVRAGQRAKTASLVKFFKGEKFNSQQESATWKAGQTNGDDVTDVLSSKRHVEGVFHDRPIIGKPSGFRHEGHIGWDPQSGFEINNVPMDDELVKKLLFGDEVAPLSVPAEILTRGPKAVEAFQKALSEGKTRVRRVPIMLIGQERAGKTSLLKSLKGETFDPDEESTRGIAIDPCLCKVTQEIWKAGQSDDQDFTEAVSFEHHAAVLTCKYLVASQESSGSCTLNGEEKHVAEVESDPVLKHNSRDDSNTGQGSGPASPDRRSSHFESGLENVKEGTWVLPEQPALLVGTRDDPDVLAATEPMASNSSTSTNNRSDVPEEIIALIEKLMQKEDLEDDNDIYCTLWDFAGQSVFYTTHSLFLTHRAIYILVNDLSKSPDQETDPLRKQGLFRKPYDDSNFVRTNLDFLHYWMTSIASFGSNESIANEESSVSLPPVIFVSTHADKPFGDAPPRDLAREVFGSLQEKPYRSHLVDDFFVVDNTRSGSDEEDKEVPRLREKILELCRELQKWQVDLPLKWLNFEKTLKRIVREGFHSLKLSEAEKVGLDVCGITDENEFRAVLNFLHDQRILVHFDDSAELDDLVVLDPQWLIDILKEVITVKPFELEQSKFREHWKELEESGLLKRELLEHVWSHLLNQRNTIEALVSIMEKFNLLCRWSSSSTEEYLVPHMLKSLPVNRNLTSLLSSTVVPSLFVRFLSVQSPQVCFPYLLVCLINEWRKEQPCFQRPNLYRNFVRFSLDPSDSSSLVLFCHSAVIEVALCAPPSTPSSSFIETTCGRLVRVLRRVLKQMRQECCWLKSTSYELCFRCPVCCKSALQLSSCDTHHVMDCSEEECAHFYSEKELQNSQKPIRCEKSDVAMDTTVPLGEFSPWLEFLQGTSEHKKNRAQDEVAQRVTEYLQLLSVQDNNEHKRNRAQAAEMVLCLPDDVMSIVQSADKVTVIQRATEHLQLDEAALMEPSADTRQKVRGLANLMKRSNRADAVRHLRTLVPSGTTGPLLDELLPVHKMPYKERRGLTVLLSGGEEWKLVASNLGFSNDEIRYLDNRIRNPADAMLVELEQRSPNCTVGYLYDVLVETEMAAVADKI